MCTHTQESATKPGGAALYALKVRGVAVCLLVWSRHPCIIPAAPRHWPESAAYRGLARRWVVQVLAPVVRRLGPKANPGALPPTSGLIMWSLYAGKQCTLSGCCAVCVVTVCVAV